MATKSELVTKLHEAYVAFTGDHEHQPQTIGGGTYAKSMPNCVAFGSEFPGVDNKIHQNNEEFSIDDLVKATAIYAKALYELIKEQDNVLLDVYKRQIKIPDNLPAAKILKDENIFIMDETRATTQRISPLKLIMLNIMPTKIVTETQLLRMLSLSLIHIYTRQAIRFSAD